MRSDELDYTLPEALIAQQPCAERSQSRLLVVDRRSCSWSDHRFCDLPELLNAGDVLVLNDTRVVPARFFLRRKSGGRIEGLWLSSPATEVWDVLLRGAARLEIGEQLDFESARGKYLVTLLEHRARGAHRLGITPAHDALRILREIGLPPLPPYIKRTDSSLNQLDRARYQTIYAQSDGAIAAPTAGLHFDERVMKNLRARGIGKVCVTLHVGLGTFQPLEVEDLKDHVMHRERYEVGEGAWEALQQARQQQRRIIALGTTSARVLETVADTGRMRGESDLFIYPPYAFRMTDALLTNFHLPRTTLLAMIYAFGGRELMGDAYRHAVQQRYRFFSYGDAMLIL